MADISLKDLERERERLHKKNLDVRISSNRLVLRVKDSRITGENQALQARGVVPGAWEFYTLEESRQVFR